MSPEQSLPAKKRVRAAFSPVVAERDGNVPYLSSLLIWSWIFFFPLVQHIRSTVKVQDLESL